MLLMYVFVIAGLVVGTLGAPAEAQPAKPAARKPASSPAKPAQQLFYDGFEAYKANRFTDAIRLFEQGLRQDATNALAAFYLGEAYAKTGNPAKAQEWYAASLAADPQSEVAAQARERVAAAPQGAASPPPPAANAGPSFEETLAFIREKLALHGRCEKDQGNSNRWVYYFHAIDVSSNNVSISTGTSHSSYREGTRRVWHESYTFSISDISRIFLAMSTDCDNTATIAFMCKNTNKCIKKDGTTEEYGGKTSLPSKTESLMPQAEEAEYFIINDNSQAEKLLKAFQHLFTLRGWQEKKDLF